MAGMGTSHKMKKRKIQGDRKIKKLKEKLADKGLPPPKVRISLRGGRYGR